MNFGALLARRALVGRDDELAALRTLHTEGGPLVAVVHGVAGAGKSALVRAFAAEHEQVTFVDGRAIEPTPAGFLVATGETPRRAGDTVPGHDAAPAAPRLLVIDAAERLRLLDDWLRHVYLPSLPETTRVVIATQPWPWMTTLKMPPPASLPRPLIGLMSQESDESNARMLVPLTDSPSPFSCITTQSAP